MSGLPYAWQTVPCRRSSNFGPGAVMSRHIGTVFLICTLITGAARAALADRRAGDRERENTARALRGYATRYAVSDVKPTYAPQTGLAGSGWHPHYPQLTPTCRALTLNCDLLRS